MTQVRIAHSAETDLLEGYVFYERQQASVGDYFLDSLYADIDALALYAGIHPKPHGRLHRLLAERFPFAIYYELKDDVATVVAVLDCRQNPASITERVG
ncbi:MAG: type II toxin-antitoxin system RelE/ParE family toxin [Gammaproteobacteria bacterium PRO9]|nr:type II toxin-antitoxin system RelE/ParE family toxin [Gammaproteobacteria bacterium PRO9]